jgi:hypothetical protein
MPAPLRSSQASLARAAGVAGSAEPGSGDRFWRRKAPVFVVGCPRSGTKALSDAAFLGESRKEWTDLWLWFSALRVS